MSDQYPPYGAPQQPEGPPQQPPHGQPYQPYGAMQQPGFGFPVRQDHGGATTSMVLGITSIGIVVIGLGCYGAISWVGAVIGPIAIVKARKALAEIDADPSRFNNRGQAATGQICGIVGTALGLLSILGILAIIALIVASEA